MAFESVDKLKETPVVENPKVFDSVVEENTKVVFNEDVEKDDISKPSSDPKKVTKDRRLTCYVTYGLYKGSIRTAEVTRSFVRKYADSKDELSKVDEADIAAERQTLTNTVIAEYRK